MVLFFVSFHQANSYGRSCRNFGGGSFDYKFKALIPFLSVKSDWRATSPSLTPLFAALSPKISDQNLKIAILFSIVGRFNSYAFGYVILITALEARAVSCVIYPLFAFI